MNFDELLTGLNLQSRPLCRQYLAIVYGHEWLPVGGRRRALAWVIGIVNGNQKEVLAVRTTSPTDTCHQALQLDLYSRGLESALFVVMASRELDPPALLSTVSAAHRCTLPFNKHQRASAPAYQTAIKTVLDALLGSDTALEAAKTLEELEAGSLHAEYPCISPQWRVALDQLKPFYLLSRQRRQGIRLGIEMADFMSGRVSRAVARHGPFSDDESAVEFVGQVLVRAQRAFDARREMVVAPLEKTRRRGGGGTKERAPASVHD